MAASFFNLGFQSPILFYLCIQVNEEQEERKKKKFQPTENEERHVLGLGKDSGLT